MESVPSKSKSKMIIGIVGAVVVLLVIGGAVYALVLSNGTKKPTTATTTTQQSSAASKEAIAKDVKDLNTYSEQEKVAHDKLKKAVEKTPPKILK